MKKRIAIVLLFILLLMGCGESKDPKSSIQKAMSETNIKFKAVHYQEETENGVLVFYETFDQKGLHLGYLRKSFWGFKWVIGGGSAEPISGQGLSWSWTRINDNLSYLYGVVIDSRIVKIQIRDSGGKIEEPPIVKANNGDLIWFIKRTNDYKGMITGLTEEGKVIYLY